MSTSSSLRQQFGAFCTNVPLGVRTLLEAPGLTTTLTAPKNGSVCVYPPLGERFSSTGSTVGGVLKKRRSRRSVCVHPWKKGSFHHFHQAGGHSSFHQSVANEATDDWRGYAPGTPGSRTCFQHFDSTGPPCRCSLFSWSFMLPPPNPLQPYS